MINELWTKIRGESIFITGGTGFFGRWLLSSLVNANKLLALDIKATILSRNPSIFRASCPELFLDGLVETVQGDVVDFDFPKGKFSRILHLATTSAQETFSGEDQLNKFHMLLNGTERVLKFAAQCEVKKILFTSSGVVYGELPSGMKHVPESYAGAPDTMDPASALGQAKRSAEFLCTYYADKYGFDYNIARCFSFIGPNLPLDLHYAIGNFIRDALWNDEISVRGDGAPIRSYLYMGDLVTWIVKLLVEKTNHAVYNVGSDQPISIRDLAYKVRDLIAPEKNINIQGDSSFSIGNFNRNWYVPNIDRARDELCLDSWTSLEEAIRLTSINAQESL